MSRLKRFSYKINRNVWIKVFHDIMRAFLDRCYRSVTWNLVTDFVDPISVTNKNCVLFVMR
jgi:hypothetical protein